MYVIKIKCMYRSEKKQKNCEEVAGSSQSLILVYPLFVVLFGVTQCLNSFLSKDAENERRVVTQTATSSNEQKIMMRALLLISSTCIT